MKTKKFVEVTFFDMEITSKWSKKNVSTKNFQNYQILINYNK